jgi:hypothetical protein
LSAEDTDPFPFKVTERVWKFPITKSAGLELEKAPLLGEKTLIATL